MSKMAEKTYTLVKKDDPTTSGFGYPHIADANLAFPLHQNPTFLPPSILSSSLRQISLILLTITAGTITCLVLIRRLRLCHGPKKTISETAATEWKMSYKAISLVVNFLLGTLGTYHFFFTLPYHTITTERIEGHEDMAILAKLQMAYQLWAIPMGLFFVDEPAEMLYHHVGVMVVGSLSAFFTNGFRYHDPFFFGLIESSSVPLVIMTVLKENPNVATRYPTANIVVSLSFCVLFLVTRVFMWLPQAYDFIRLAGLMCYTCSGFVCRVGFGSAITTCVFLTALQLVWAGKIMKGILDFVKVKKV